MNHERFAMYYRLRFTASGYLFGAFNVFVSVWTPECDFYISILILSKAETLVKKRYKAEDLTASFTFYMTVLGCSNVRRLNDLFFFPYDRTVLCIISYTLIGICLM